jgi:hypothetical protein
LPENDRNKMEMKWSGFCVFELQKRPDREKRVLDFRSS